VRGGHGAQGEAELARVAALRLRIDAGGSVA